MAKNKSRREKSAPDTDTEPLPGGGSNFRTMTFVRKGDLFVIKPTIGLRIFGIVFLLFGGVPLAVMIYLFIENGARTEYWVVGGFGLLFLLVGLGILLSPKRFEFDWINDVFRQRRPWTRQERSLSDILGVQLIHGGWHTVRNSNGAQNSYYTYQVNLVINDEKEPRANLLNQSDFDSCWQCADQLADFLEVPFMDSVSEQSEE